MSTPPTPAGPPDSETLLQPVHLLAQWERARPADSNQVTPELRTAFNQFVAEVLSDTQETNLELADVQDVLRQAAGLTVGRAEASGPSRAQQALKEAYQTAQAVGPGTACQGQILILLQSRPDAELEMDELTDITETMWRNVGPEWELVFGYGIVPGLPAEIRLTFLLAPSSAQ